VFHVVFVEFLTSYKTVVFFYWVPILKKKKSVTDESFEYFSPALCVLVTFRSIYAMLEQN
jgi:hypothetical protein